MSFRTVVITNKAHLSYKSGYLLVRKAEDLKMIHISEIDNLLIDTTMASISSYLLCELAKNKVKVVFCDEKRNPYGELIPYYGSYNNSKKIQIQNKWTKKTKQAACTLIVKHKILNQAYLLSKIKKEEYQKLLEYSTEIKNDDSSNREGHAAKVYFGSLFGKGFSRGRINSINSALNYGYSILLSTINKEVINNGYLTQLGIKHKNEFNNYNLSCDLIEPFRIIVDEFVYFNMDREFDKEYQNDLVNLLNRKIKYLNKTMYLSDVIKIYVKNILDCISDNNIDNLKGFNMYEEQVYEDATIF